METNSSVAEKSGVVTGREPDADGAPAEQQRHLSPDARVHPDARVGNATIEAGAVIERDTEILSGSSVGRNSTVGENNIVMGHVGANTRIDPSSTILGNVGDGCKIGSHVTVPKGLAVPDGTTIPDDCEIVWGEGNKPEVSAKRGDWQATENGRPSGNGDGIADPDPYMRNTMRSWDTRDPKGPNEPMLVHPDAKIGAGSMACGGSTMEAETSIGMGVVVDNAHLTGKAKVEGRTWVEQGAVVRSTVGVSARIGANAVVDGPVETDGFDEIHSTLYAAGDPALLLTHMPLRNVPEGCVNVHGHLLNQEAPLRVQHINLSVEQLRYRPRPWEAICRLARHMAAGNAVRGRTTAQRLTSVP